MLKYGICIDCSKNEDFESKRKEMKVIASRCLYHYKAFRAKVCAKRKEMKGNTSIKKINRFSNETKRKEMKPVLNLVSWYRARMSECLGICAECGERIPIAFRHHSIAHVLPKSPNSGFPSVATHEENFIELGAGCGCHHKYDSNWLSASKMKIFPLAKEKFKLMEPFIAEEERKRIPEIFLNTTV